MSDYLLDTNHADAYLKDRRILRLRVRRALREGDSFYTCATVVGELYFRAFASSQVQRNLADVETLEEQLPSVGFGALAAREYGRIAAELKRAGRPIGEADVHIAAIARSEGLTLLTTDAHFSQIEGLQVENWLAGGEADGQDD